MSRLRLAFMGTPDFACPALEALIAAGHEIAAVYCQPPRPAGRGQRPQASPVQRLAERRGLPLRMPTGLKDEAEQAAFRALGLDAAVVVAYGLILPKAVLEAPRLGCLNIHASLLPRWRGAAPIQRAILAGDAETGITIMQMDPGLDTGPILMQEAVPIGIADTAADLHDRLAALGARMIVATLAGLSAGKLVARPQPADGATYAAKLDRTEARIDWREPATLIERRLRAFTPWPGLWFEARGERLRLVGAHVLAGAPAAGSAPGTVLAPRDGAAFAVACGEGTALALDSLQRAGRGALPAADFLRGFALEPGTRLP
ncbi:MAG: methionyl-tRNA formyltransferase [Pseudomonadota bacterium]